ncbi:DUF624 domain-containing protein (plasmid) [Vibrio sp. HDW18]|uniref:DUF624 domain-containing protein n=1 Tax=Vibrio sp. HDW18 TaxID=2714948 RepID=UPI00140C21F4|nr:DUF624 domain-containing protein [Vibrio sp. HDW18]QIL86820.1 DUF624 domain-containing protein [Vibrio sp. HDW18]
MNSCSPLIILCHWLTRLAWLNLAWIGFSLLGGVLFGVFPATVMVCVMLRRYLNGAAKVTMKQMWQQYKQEFMPCNQLGWLLLLPTGCGLWYVQWVVIHAERTWAILALSFLPVACLVLLVSYCVLIMQGCYHANNISQRIDQALLLLKQEKIVLFSSLGVLVICLLLTMLMPILGLFYGLSPSLLTAVGLLWLKRDELKRY